MSKGARVADEDRQRAAARAVALYARGRSIRAIALELHRSYGFVHKLLASQEVEFRTRGGARVQRRGRR